MIWAWVCEGCNRFAAAVKLEKQLADIPEKEHLLRALQKRRLNRYDGFLDRILTELYITGKHIRIVPPLIRKKKISNSNRVSSSLSLWRVVTRQYFSICNCIWRRLTTIITIQPICHYTRNASGPAICRIYRHNNIEWCQNPMHA